MPATKGLSGAVRAELPGEPAISELQKRFQDVVDRHYEGLWSYVCFLTAGSPDSEDILHQAFLVAFDRLAAGDPFRGDLGKWLRITQIAEQMDLNVATARVRLFRLRKSLKACVEGQLAGGVVT